MNRIFYFLAALIVASHIHSLSVIDVISEKKETILKQDRYVSNKSTTMVDPGKTLWAYDPCAEGEHAVSCYCAQDENDKGKLVLSCFMIMLNRCYCLFFNAHKYDKMKARVAARAVCEPTQNYVEKYEEKKVALEPGDKAQMRAVCPHPPLQNVKSCSCVTFHNLGISKVLA